MSAPTEGPVPPPAPAPAPASPARPPPAATAAARPPGPAPKSLPRTPVVVFDKVTKVFQKPDGGTTVAIKDVSFTVDDIPHVGEFITLLGPSGCGKSTILNLISGLEPTHPATSGSVRVRGQAVGGPGPDRGMVFQSYSSFPCYTVLDNVAFGLMLQGVPREEREHKAMEWIRKVRLAGHEDKYPHQLSGGMRQRVAIARSLIMRPRILLMDEPFGALDRPTRWEMQDLLISLWNEVEATVFLVTHDLEEAVFMGDRIFVLAPNPGRLSEVVEVGRPTYKASEAHRDPAFAEMVREVGDKLSKVTRGPH